ncbi:sigma-54 interaction domain-containing protein [Peribacillus sp. YIM B13482]|uniref:sigma-54 interaction domain-containing protein n=1 Tax=Peribacillus sp. YIM B13482 TaxID=3366298 RepID=UPI00366B9F03
MGNEQKLSPILSTAPINTLFPNNEKMGKVLDVISKVTDLDVTVLLVGESGVGKNRIARMIHEMSKRSIHPFIEVNCGAIPESLIESELFGYEEGAFTGAKKGGKQGYFEAAGEGTLILDEIGELPMNLQVKLLSVLQNKSLMRIGGNKSVQLSCRIICATNQNLEELVNAKLFREDLYYRINIVKIIIPPLRERREEIISLIFDITKEMNKKYDMNKRFTPAMLAWLGQQEWKGNIRELRNFIEKAVITSGEDEINLEIDGEDFEQFSEKRMKETTLQKYMESIEKEFIMRMYQKYPSSIKLAEKLNISQSTANRKIQKYIEER